MMQHAAKAALAVLISLAFASCMEQAGSGSMEMPPRKDYRVEVGTVHAHILKSVKVVFTVYDMAQCTDHTDVTSCAKVAGLPVNVAYRDTKATQTQTVAPAAGVLEDKGDGTYEWTTMFTAFGAYTVGVEFQEEGNHYAAAFAFETSRAGGENYFCSNDADADYEYAFQIRWNTTEPIILASGTDVTFNIELMRSFNETINTTQPWTNKFDHLLPAALQSNLPTVTLMSGTGAQSVVVEALVPTYAGKGLYTAKHMFMETGTYWLKVGFTDDLNCVVTGGDADDEANYRFEVMPATHAH
ncbi:MAG: hypothetical protein HY904_03915 [Deltaproteobacteria bacterium]|nr:hypothetical protein [Deltaproteobacteria bacterium]